MARLRFTLSTFLLLVLANAHESTAAAPEIPVGISQFRHRSWTSNEGLPQDSVHAITQTPDGYLWMTTQEGIARFDGVTFRTYDSRNSYSFADFLYTLFADSEGTLWAGGASGIVRFDGRDQWTIFDEKAGWPGSSARFVAEGEGRTLWIGFGSDGGKGARGIGKFQDGKLRLFTIAHGLPHDQVYGVFAEPRTPDVWFGTRGGLVHFRDDRVARIWTRRDGLPSDFVREIQRDSSGRFWIGTDAGLAMIDSGGAVARVWTTKDGLPSDDILAIEIDEGGTVWAGTAEGLARVLANGAVDRADPESEIGSDRILDLFIDHEQNVWVGAHDTGLHRLRLEQFRTIGTAEGLAGASIRGVFQDSKDRIWLGSALGGVTLLDGARVSTISEREGLPGKAVAFGEDRDGNIWIGTSAGLARWTNGVLTRIPHEGFRESPSINEIHPTRDGTIWVGSSEGLSKVVDGVLVATAVKQPNPIRVIDEIDGQLFLAGSDNFGYLRDGRFVPIDAIAHAHDNVMAHLVDRRGVLWLGTWGQGLLRISKGRVFRYTSKHGLYDATAWSIIDDGRGNLLFGGNRGVSQISLAQLDAVAEGRAARVSPLVYDTADGMKKRETNWGSPSAIRARDGSIWFGTTGGAAILRPDAVTNLVKPPVVVESVIVNRVEHRADEPLVLGPGVTDVEFRYTALSFSAPARVRFRYKLEGLSDEWIEAGSRRSAFFTSLEPGRYMFRVIAANPDGLWNESGDAVALDLRARYHETWWFRALMVIGVVLVGYGVARLRRRQRRIEHAVLHDALTGLPNRVLFEERANVALVQAERKGRGIAILFLDLDGFKGVNDSFGHASGDRLLQLVAARLSSCVRDIDTLARIGGDEFVVLIADLGDESDAAAVAGRIIEAMQREFVFDQRRSPLGVSIGIALHPFDGADVSTLLRAADRAMYRAKLSGGNSFQYNAGDSSERVRLR